ncbi:MAG: RNA polymerase sigma factor [Candidatus Marinimicrobia bacterium]|nr:RNA polymerase sigma factor [Candidatus Neomarinimicrobiota bacterium]
MDDKTRQLIINAQAGNAESFHQLVALHDDRIMALAFQLSKNQSDAEDIYQDVFVKAWKNIKSFRMESEFFTWLYRITVNTFLTHQKKLSRMKIQDSEYDPLDWVPSSSDERTSSDEVNSAVQIAVKSLPEKQQTVFILKHMQNLKIREIANIMEITEGTVKKYLFRAMEKMRKELKEYRYA